MPVVVSHLLISKSSRNDCELIDFQKVAVGPQATTLQNNIDSPNTRQVRLVLLILILSDK